MSEADVRTSHPYIVHTKGTCGGRARIEGTRIPVWLVVDQVVRLGRTPEEVTEAHPHVSMAQIYDALSFYYDHRDEIELDLREQEEAWRNEADRQSSSTKT